MIKAHTTPTESNISITVPQSYIGKQVEILVYTVDELVDVNATKPKTMSAYKGLLSKAEATKLQKIDAQSREEW